MFRVKSFDLRRWFATPDAAATARPLALVTLALLPLRLWARAAIGYGDSEALYATWGAHPQLFYRDHPGLLGVFARGLAEGAGGIPTPTAIHGFSLAVLCGFPFLFFAVCRLFQRDEPYGQRRALVAAVAVAVTPSSRSASSASRRTSSSPRCGSPHLGRLALRFSEILEKLGQMAPPQWPSRAQ